MRRFRARLAAFSAFAVATALFTACFVGGALANPGNGHGNSANAPGQQKQAQQSQPAPQQQSQPAQQQQASQQQPAPAASTTTAQQPQQQSSQPGVKPSSTTKHWTHTTVGAKPDVSKRYGNGKTAAQIAASRGAPADQPLTGPGNSQPHKTYDCRHKNNRSGGVDVHAIKHYSATGCASSSQQSGGSTQTKQPESKPSTPVKTPERPTEHKVTLCHATGSATNPYVLITVDYHALGHGHTAAKGDIIPPTTINGVTYSANWDAHGQAIFNNGCRPVVAAVQPPATTTTTEQKAPPVTTTTPAATTTTVATPTTTTVAETPVTTTVTVPVTSTVTVTVTTPSTTTTTTTVAAGVAGATTVTTPGSTGGVMGAAATLTKPKPAAAAKPTHGVLGTVTHLTGGTLPYTGFPVWLAVLIAAALILGGIVLRRRTAGVRL